MPERKSIQVANLVNRLGRASHALQFASGLNPAQWDALRYLARANRYSRTPTALAQFLGTTKGTASQTLRALETKGLVSRAPHGRDRRVVDLEITGPGREMLEMDPIRRVEAAASSLSANTNSAIAAGLEALLARLQADCGSKLFGICATCGHFRPDGIAFHCGLNGDALDEVDKGMLCVNFTNESNAPPGPTTT
ncbi:MAG: MarR family winged helix-turn-helix transcriptional regulator [Alphaproteobacteria bacterium]